MEDEIDFDSLSSVDDTPNFDAVDSYYDAGNRLPGVLNLAGIAAGSVVDLADTVTSSVGLTDRGAINQKFLGAINSPGLTGWYEKNRGGIEVGSAIGGVILSAAVTKRILNPGGVAMRAIRNVPYAKTIATLDAKVDQAKRVAMLTAKESALRGTMGAERFSQTAMNIATFGKSATQFSAHNAARNVFRTKIGQGLAFNVTQEAVMAATLNQNSFLYSDDIGHNIAWGVVGLGIGAGIDSMIGAYTLRRIANSDAIRRANALALDTKGLEAGRVTGAEELSKMIGGSEAENLKAGFLFDSGERHSAEITSLALSAKQGQKQTSFTERGNQLFGKKEPLATQQMTQAKERLNKLTVKGLYGASETGFSTKQPGLDKALAQSLDRDPVFLYGVRELGTPQAEMTVKETVEKSKQALESQLTAKQTLLKDGGRWENVKNKDGSTTRKLRPLSPEAKKLLPLEIQSLRQRASDSHYVMLEVGEWAPLEFAEAALKFEPKKVIPEGDLGSDSVKNWFIPQASPKSPKLGIGSDGQMFLGKAKALENLAEEDMIHMYHAAAAAVNEMKKANHQLVIQKDAPWFILDMAEQLVKATGREDSVKFIGNMTRQTALVESFAQKVDAIRRKEANLTRAKGNIDATQAYKMKVFFNLPRLTPYETGLMMTHETPLDLVLAGVKNGDEIRQMNPNELLKMIQDAKEIKGFTEAAKSEFDSLQGNSFNFLLDYEGNPMKPIIATRREVAPDLWTRDELIVRQSLNHASVREILTGSSADDWNREIVNLITSSPAFAEARKIMELADDQGRSFVPGFQHAAPQTTRGAFMNSITHRSRRDIDTPVLQAASAVNELTTKIINTVLRESVNNVLGDSVTLINSPRNVASKLLLNQFNSYRPGWEVLREPKLIKDSSGKSFYQFVLDHESAMNQERFAAAHGRELLKDQVLLTPEGKPLVLDDLGLDYRQRMQQLHGQRLAAKNTLLRSQGLKEIKETPWFVEPGSDKGKYVAYMFDETNQIVPGQKILANTPEQLQRLIAEAEQLPSFKPGFTIRQRDYVTSFLDLWDRANMEFVAPNITAIQPGKKNRGIASSAVFNPNGVEDELVATRNNIARHGGDLLEILYKEPIQAAKARAKIAEVQTGIGKADAKHGNIHDRWIQNLLGRNALNSKDSYFGDFFSAAESRINAHLREREPLSQGKLYQTIRDHLATAIPGMSTSGEKFNKLAKELGNYMPFKSVTEMVEKQTGNRTPKELSEISGSLSWFEAASRLRWIESMTAVVNVGSLLSNTPAVMKAIQPLAGESLEETAKRNGSLAMMMATEHGENLGVIHSYKLAWKAMKNAWNPPANLMSKVEKATRLGFMDQDVAELDRAWGAIESKEGLHGFLFGNEAADFGSVTGLGVRNKIAKSGGIDKWLSILSDKSEAFTRQWGMHMGFEVAEKIGIKNDDEAIMFAHELTNKMIANYDPRNRPELFQGAIGAPIGLFQSYVFNYYQRMFRYLETQDSRALATQAAMQAGMFGTQSLPGWDQFNWAFMNGKSDDQEDPVDSIYKRFGQTDGDLIMHGTLSSLPKLVGLPGMSLYTRGDSGFRAPVFNMPIGDTVSRAFNGVVAGVSQLMSEQGLSATHGAEILSNMITNRPLAGIIENTLAGGYDTDTYGQVVSRSRTFAEQTYRALGIRTMSQQKEIELYYADKDSQVAQAAKQLLLNAETRAAIRAGDYDRVPEMFATYVKNGGSPAYYTRWVKESADAALDSRAERLLIDSLNNQSNPDVQTISRLLDAQIDINEDDTASDDYGREEEVSNIIASGWETEPEGEPIEDSSGFTAE